MQRLQPEYRAACFQLLHLKSDLLVSKFPAFKWVNVYRYGSVSVRSTFGDR
jgi:hypothetical protein